MTVIPSIDVDLFHTTVTAAVRAPSVYNVQPWRFALADGTIEVRVDPYRLLPVADPDRWAARVACGAAIANIELSLTVAGVRAKTRLWPRSADELLVATISADGACAPSPRQLALASAIPRRRSNRRPFSDTPVPADARARIVAAAEAAGGWLVFADERTSVANLAAIVRDADQLLRGNAAYVAEMQAWTSRYHAERVGIPAEAAGIAPAPQDVLAMRDYGGRQRAEGRDFEQEPLLAVLGTSGGGRYDDVVAGMALQMVLLTATDAGLAASLLSQAIEVPRARDELRHTLRRRGTPQMIIRLGFGQPTTSSPRRPIDSVIDTTG
ncbi:MAG TPA: nitroreductase family protein [Micromonosporaceae bacterium]|jgi:nitroreductase